MLSDDSSFDLGSADDLSADFSDAGSSIVQAGSDTGSSIWDSVGGFLGGMGSSGLNIGSTILKAAQQFGAAGSPASSAGPGVGTAPSQKAPGAKKANRALVRMIQGHGGHRRMNPGNFRALGRAMRRLTAFERRARKVYHFTHPARHKSHFKFHRKRRR